MGGKGDWKLKQSNRILFGFKAEIAPLAGIFPVAAHLPEKQFRINFAKRAVISDSGIDVREKSTRTGQNPVASLRRGNRIRAADKSYRIRIF